jgi:diadenosine tetraphosphate (Ap4A) HIT family hydrolase
MDSPAFSALRQFISEQMSLSHVYQPVMLKTILSNGGSASRRQIAKVILDRDPTQLAYYEMIVRDMVGRVLTNNRKITTRTGENYSLSTYGNLTPDQVGELVALCDVKLKEYEAKRGQAIWDHRRRGHRPISGSVRYEVLKRASFRCELCGVSAEVKALEVDHINPKNQGGADDLANFQALCYTCNASKRDKDDTDFRGLSAAYRVKADACLFCSMEQTRIVDEDDLVYAIRDGFPVTAGHTLVIPKRHVADYFGLLQPELNAMNRMLHKQRAALMKDDPSISAFNIGMNCGEAAGQTVFHSHTHIIPRRKGDVEHPRGGVRHTIPGKGHY